MIIIILAQQQSNRMRHLKLRECPLAVQEAVQSGKGQPLTVGSCLIPLSLDMPPWRCVCNFRGHEVKRLHLRLCAPGPAGGPLERPQGIRDGKWQSAALLLHVWVIKSCQYAVRPKERDCFQVSILTSQTVTSLMIFIEGLANKFR